MNLGDPHFRADYDLTTNLVLTPFKLGAVHFLPLTTHLSRSSELLIMPLKKFKRLKILFSRPEKTFSGLEKTFSGLENNSRC